MADNSSLSKVPIVSVVMTTYREDWIKLRRAIESILNQTFINFEFIIVFEGKDANQSRIEETFFDFRLILDCQPQGIGRSRCHNAGLSLARGQYIARMDGDDFSYPERLAIEVDYLKNHPDVALVAAGGRLMDKNNRVIGQRLFPKYHEEIVHRMAFVNPILHPTVLWDRERTGYDLRYAPYHVDDLELWLQLLENGKRFANLPVLLIDYQQPEIRPIKSWRGVFWVRLLHWKLVFQHPRYLLGLLLFMIFSVTPTFCINALTRGNRYADKIRSIQREEAR